jgi:serpin B
MSFFKNLFSQNNTSNKERTIADVITDVIDFCNKDFVSNSPIFVCDTLDSKLVEFTNNENSVVFSPFSLLSALSLLLVGLTDDTLKQVLTNLKIENKLKLFENLLELSKQIKHNVSVSNVIITKKEVEVFNEYLETVKKLGDHLYFDEKDYKTIPDKVNEIVSERTNGMIKNILNQDDINEDTFLVLVNTIYFKSDWSKQFKTYDTCPKKFNRKQLDKSSFVDMMMIHDEIFGYYETDKYQVASLPYLNDFTFLLLVPKDLNEEIPTFDVDILRKLQNESLHVELPKFEHEVELDLIPFFKSIGITQMFEYMEADDMINRHDDQKITLIKQKCKIVVNEQGTEASAATAIGGMVLQCAKIGGSKIYNIIADRPFRYQIVNKSNGVILFSGTYR